MNGENGAAVTDGKAMRNRLWWMSLVIAAMLCAVYPLLSEPLRHVVFFGLGVASVALITGGTAARRLRPRRPWLLLAAGQAAFLVGDALWVFYEMVLDADPFPSIADAFYLAGYPLLALALWELIRHRAPVRDGGSLIDAGVLTVGAGVVTWVFVVVPLATDASLGFVGRLVSAAYPAADVLLLALLVRLSLTPGGRSTGYRLLAGSFSVLLLADLLFAVTELTGADLVTASDLGYIAAYVLAAAAVAHPSITRVTAPSRPAQTTLTRGRLLLLAAASLLAPVVLVAQTLTGMAVEGLVIGGASAVLFLLVVLRMSGLLRQVEAQKAEIAALARLDALTGIDNRRSWEERLPVELSRAARDAEPVCLALLDLDHFKRFNDTRGHQAGDGLLREAVRAWRRQLRSVDVLARYGGEEFGVVLPATSLSDAVRSVERLRAVVPLGQTCSAGVALWDGRESPDQLVARADRALYEAKAAGRDRVMVADEPAVLS